MWNLMICNRFIIIIAKKQQLTSRPYSEYKTADCQHCVFQNSHLCFMITFSCNLKLERVCFSYAFGGGGGKDDFINL